jgi:hypothetical protein
MQEEMIKIAEEFYQSVRLFLCLYLNFRRF